MYILNVTTLIIPYIFYIYHLTTHICPNLMSQYDEQKERERTRERVVLIIIIYRLHLYMIHFLRTVNEHRFVTQQQLHASALFC